MQLYISSNVELALTSAVVGTSIISYIMESSGELVASSIPGISIVSNVQVFAAAASDSTVAETEALYKNKWGFTNGKAHQVVLDTRIVWTKSYDVSDEYGLQWNLIIVLDANCDEGYFANNATQSCQKCVDPFYSFGGTSSVDCGFCLSGYYRDGSACVACPEGMDCTVGSKLETVMVQPGHWRSLETSVEIETCLRPLACQGGSVTGEYCAKGYTGAICAVCSSGYFITSEYECLLCDVSDSSAKFFLVGFFVMVGILVVVAVAVSYSPKKLQLSGRFQARLKILITFSQILAGFPPVLNFALPFAWERFSESVLSFFSLKFLSDLPGAGCLGANFYDRLLFDTVAPLSAIVVLLVAYKIADVTVKRHGSTAMIGGYVQTQTVKKCCSNLALLVSYLCVASTSSTIFQTFACQDFHPDLSFLKADYSISCATSTYTFYYTYAVVMVMVFPVGIPLPYGVLLYRKRDVINPALLSDEGEAATAVSSPGGAQGISRDTSFRDARQSRDSTFRDSRVSRASTMQERLSVREALAEDAKGVTKLKFLYQDYKPAAWYWEVLETTRRIILTGALVVFEPGSSVQLFAAILICYTSSLMYLTTSPFINPTENRIAMAAQIDVFLVLSVGALFNLDSDKTSDDTRSELIGISLIVATICVIIYCLVPVGYGVIETELAADSKERAVTESEWKAVALWKSATKKKTLANQGDVGGGGGGVKSMDYPDDMRRGSYQKDEEIAGSNPLAANRRAAGVPENANTMRDSDQTGL